LDKEQEQSAPPSLTVSMSEEMKSSSSSLNWWADMKDDLDKETGAAPESKPPSSPSSTSSSSSSYGGWWANMTENLDRETLARSNRMSMEPDSPNKQPVLERTRSRSQSMSAAMGKYDLYVSSLLNFLRPEEDTGGLGTMLRIYNGIYRGETVVGADNTAIAHGVGTFTAANGELYVGQWKEGKRHGKGLRTWREGKEYIGNWENNKRTGNGLLTNPNGDLYIGETQYGFQQGHGMMIYANGDKYSKCLTF
jgi:hypothetical protein